MKMKTVAPSSLHIVQIDILYLLVQISIYFSIPKNTHQTNNLHHVTTHHYYQNRNIVRLK